MEGVVVVGGCGGCGVSANVAEGEVEVTIGVEVGEREGVVVEEGWVRRVNESALCANFLHHFHGLATLVLCEWLLFAY